jgi:hypothetical protein
VNRCPNCGSEYDRSAEVCSACGDHLGYPNVRAAADPKETEALMARYETAVEAATLRGAGGVIEAFQEAVSRSKAVVNVSVFLLREFSTDKKTLYTNYQLAVSAQTRKAADDEMDRQRRAVDAILFGVYAEKLRFAALSMDGRGLKSYGAYTITLKDVSVSKRSSLLEENSFAFVEHHKLKPGDPLPVGFRAVWNNKEKLAMAKLADFVASDTKSEQFPSLLLYSGGDRKNDRFIEIQIFGTFNRDAIDTVNGRSVGKNTAEIAVANVAKEHLINAGKSWVEDD